MPLPPSGSAKWVGAPKLGETRVCCRWVAAVHNPLVCVRNPPRRILHIPQPQAKRVQPFTMPLMTLASTAIDMPREASTVVDTLLEYLHTDGMLCREAPGKLATLQAEVSGRGPSPVEAGTVSPALNVPTGSCSPA